MNGSNENKMHTLKTSEYLILRLLITLMIVSAPSLSWSALDLKQIQRTKIGLVLSGGGARGFAHIGVLQVIDSLNIPIDYIAGTSIGSIIGGLYAYGYSVNELDSLARTIEWPIIFSDKPPRSRLTYFEKWDMERFQLPLNIHKFKIQEPSGLIAGQKISLLLSRLTLSQSGQTDFDSLYIPFRCIAADIITGNEVVLKKGPLSKAIRASMSVPSIFTPIDWGDSLLIDGGVLNNLPVDVAQEMGADYIIAVNVGVPPKSRDKLTGALSIFIQSYALASKRKEDDNILKADLVITPDLHDISSIDFVENKIETMIKRGKEAAITQISKLKLYSNKNIRTNSKKKYNNIHNALIYGIRILGNEKLPFSFIYQILGIKAGDFFDLDLLEARIELLYSLGYFETVTYHIEYHSQNQYILHIKVKEKPGGMLRLGFRYQDDKKGILGINLKYRDFPFPGILSDLSYLFSGLQIFEWELSYPRRMFGSGIYPYLYSFFQDIPVNIFFEREKVARYHQRSYGAAGGFGIVFKNWGIIRTDYMIEKLLVSPSIAFDEIFPWPEWKHNVHLGRIYLEIDLLDNPLTPKRGYKARIGYENTLDFIKQLGSYFRIYFDQHFYGTIINRNTSSLHLFFGFSKDMEFYRYFYLGGPSTFVGYNYDEFAGSNLGIYRIENQFNLNNTLSILAVMNAGHIWEDYKKINFTKDYKTGAGIGIQINTIVGPFRYILGFSGTETFQYFTVGFSLGTRIYERQ